MTDMFDSHAFTSDDAPAFGHDHLQTFTEREVESVIVKAYQKQRYHILGYALTRYIESFIDHSRRLATFLHDFITATKEFQSQSLSHFWLLLGPATQCTTVYLALVYDRLLIAEFFLDHGSTEVQSFVWMAATCLSRGALTLKWAYTRPLGYDYGQIMWDSDTSVIIHACYTLQSDATPEFQADGLDYYRVPFILATVPYFLFNGVPEPVVFETDVMDVLKDNINTERIMCIPQSSVISKGANTAPEMQWRQIITQTLNVWIPTTVLQVLIMDYTGFRVPNVVCNMQRIFPDFY